MHDDSTSLPASASKENIASMADGPAVPRTPASTGSGSEADAANALYGAMRVFQFAGDATDTAVFIFNCKDRTSVMTEVAARQWGLDTMLTGVPYSVMDMDFVTEGSKSEYIRLHESMMMGESEAHGQVELCSPEGNSGLYELTLRALIDAEGKPVGSAIGIFKNITTYEEKYRRQSAMTQALSEGLASAYFVDLAKDTFLVERTSNYAKKDTLAWLHSQPQDSTYSETVADYCHKMVCEADRARMLYETLPSTILRNFKERNSYFVKYRREGAAPGKGNYEMHVVKSDYDSTESQAFISFRCIDDQLEHEIEQQQKLKEAFDEASKYARRAQENLDIVNEIIGSGLWHIEFDESGQMEKCIWSDAFRKMLGYEDENDFPNEINALFDRMDPDEREGIIRAFWECVAAGNDWNIRCRLKNKRGIYSWYNAKGKVVRYKTTGLPRLFVGTFVDITEQMEREEVKNALEQAYETAQRASTAKSDFLSRMSHDIRTPMNAIVGMTALAAANIDDKERVTDCLAKITASSRNLLTLINEVLDMSRIESGKLDLNLEDFDLAKLVEHMVATVSDQARAHGHNLEVDIRDIEHELVIGDSERLQQAFMNLADNAIKFTPDGGEIRITVTERPTHKQHTGCYEFVFEDNGVGMEPEFVERIFEPFARADDKRVFDKQGSGLGMPITQSIVSMMNGSIDIESAPDAGTKVKATVFLELQDEGVSWHEDLLANLPVLVVDDDEPTCVDACHMLCDLGMDGEWVLTGEEAVERTIDRHDRDEDYFAVILDWKMPGMDGLETTRAIRAAVGDEVPIIIISAYDWSAIEDEAREAGANAFISKPLFKSRMSRVFRNLLSPEEAEPDEEELEPMGELKSALEDISNADFTGKRALLVEDNLLNAEIAMDVLAAAKLEVVHVFNGQEAVAELESSEDGHYDIVFMDIRMPVMNGHEAARAIRANSRDYLKNIPIIAMSADAFAQDVEASRAAGINEHMAKPIDFNRLYALLEEHLG